MFRLTFCLLSQSTPLQKQPNDSESFNLYYSPFFWWGGFPKGKTQEKHLIKEAARSGLE